jgi:hypothetical protein
MIGAVSQFLDNYMAHKKLKKVFLVYKKEADPENSIYRIKGPPLRCFASLQEAKDFKKSYDLKMLSQDLKSQIFCDLYLDNLDEDYHTKKLLLNLKCFKSIDEVNEELLLDYLNNNKLSNKEISTLLHIARYTDIESAKCNSDIFIQV